MSEPTTSKYTREQMIAKIEKLLALANDPGLNEHVAAQAAAKAQGLMQQWAIDEAALDKASGKQSDPFTTEDVPFLKLRPEPWEVQLRMSVAKAMMVHTFRDTGKQVFTFAGRSTDVKIATHMFVQLRTTLERLSRSKLSEHGADMKRRYNKSIYNVTSCRALAGCHPTVYRQRWLDSWLTGAQIAISDRLAAQARATVAANSTALVVVETRRSEAEAWATEEFKLTNSKRSKARQHFSNALNQGIKDGQNVEIRKGLTVNENKQIEG